MFRQTRASVSSRTLGSAKRLSSAASGTLWGSIYVTMYPLGVIAERHKKKVAAREAQKDLGITHPFSGDASGDGVAVIVLHDAARHAAVEDLLSVLRARPALTVLSASLHDLGQSFESASATLHRALETLCEETGRSQVHVVAHGMSGLVARHYLQTARDASRLASLHTVGTPHSGSLAAHCGMGRFVSHIRPQATFVTELGTASTPEHGVQWTNVWSDMDHLVLPSRAAQLDPGTTGASNVRLHGVGHYSLLRHPRFVASLDVSLSQSPKALPAPRQAEDETPAAIPARRRPHLPLSTLRNAFRRGSNATAA